MKNKILFIGVALFLFFSVQNLFAQKNPTEIKKQASNAFNNKDYATALIRINEMEKLYKQMPYTFLSMRIISLNNIISDDSINNFQNIEECKKFINNYIKIPNIKDLDNSYDKVIEINNSLIKFPNDYDSFIKYKDELEKEKRIKIIKDSIANSRKDRLEPFSEYVNINYFNLENISDDEFNNLFESTKTKYEKIIKETLDKEKLIEKRKKILKPYSNYVSDYDNSRLGEIDDDAFNDILKQAKQRKKIESSTQPQLNSFSSIGIQSGEIAKFGLIYEHGGRKRVGFRISARTSLTSEQDILNGTATKNKTEIELGPNFRILNRLYLNIGFGYGYYERLLNNDFASNVYLEKTGYSVATTGLMFRISKAININAGAAFMDIDKDLYKPEFTFGVTYNLKKNTVQENNTKPSTNYKTKLSSFSSLGFQSGEIAKYGLLYETGGRKTVGFRISARTTLKPEQIFGGGDIENRKEIELGPNFRMSNRFYLNLGIGYGNYEFPYVDNIGYYIGTTGIMYRISRVININGGLSFNYINNDNYLDNALQKTEITFGISFNLRGKYKY